MRKARIPLLVLGLLAFATHVCAQSATVKSSYIGDAKAVAVVADKDGMAEMLIATEKAVWAAIYKHDMATFGSYLAEDHVYVGAGGTSSKAESLQMLANIPVTSYTLDEFKVVMIDKDAAIVTYRATFKKMSGDQDASKQNINVDVGVQKTPDMSAGQGEMTHERNTTVWVKRNGKWLALLHQETTEQVR